MKLITKQMITERNFNIEHYFEPDEELKSDILSLPPRVKDFWMRIDRIYELSKMSLFGNGKNSSVLTTNPFIGEINPTNCYPTSKQLIDGIEKYIPHLLLTHDWEHLEKINRGEVGTDFEGKLVKYNNEKTKLQGIYELMYVVCQITGSKLYCTPKLFVNQHNADNPFWEWTYDEVSQDVDFFPKDMNGKDKILT